MNVNDFRVARAIRYLQPCPDVAIERLCWTLHQLKPSTVRGTRLRLKKKGIVQEAGHCRDGTTKWELAKAAEGKGTP